MAVGRSRGARSAPRHVEPASFAWSEPLAPLPDPEPIVVEVLVPGPAPAPRVVVMGRGPTVMDRLGGAMPNPQVASASIGLMLVSLVGVALMSPSGDQATAARGQFKLPSARVAKTPIEQADGAPLRDDGKLNLQAGRDPFADEQYVRASLKLKQQQRQKAKRAADKRKTGTGKGSKRRPRAESLAGLPLQALVKPTRPQDPSFEAKVVFYASDTPWEYLKLRSGDWIEANGAPTFRLTSITPKGADFYVVSDVEVLEGEGRRNAQYDYPIRVLHVKNDAVIRFADYRDVEGEDVVYTLRYSRAEQLRK